MPPHITRTDTLRALWPWLPLWIVFASIAIFQHGPMPMYSTRTLSVAWDMWHRHSFVVPYLNGLPYSDKTPLLFWLIHLGWWAGGVSDVWPRVLEILLGAVELILASILARRLFPEQPAAARAAPWVLASFSFGFLFGLQIMYEVLLAACVLAALVALAPGRRREAPRFILFSLAIGLGLLAKGPVMLLHVVFPWLLGPWWNDWARREWKRWYFGGLFALIAAGAVLLAWALWASAIGGPVYREQLLFHQTAGRVVEAFTHAKPIWWYLPLLPVFVLPFALWPRLWLAVGALRRPFEPGLRFALAWLIPVLLVFSLISSKQPYYLLPEFAGLALLLSTALARVQHDQTRPVHDRWLGPWPLAVVFIGAGLFLLALPLLIGHGWIHAASLQAAPPYSAWFGALFVALGALVMLGRNKLHCIALAGLIGAAAANGLFTLIWWPNFDLQHAATLLARAQAHGEPIANTETYNGQFDFLGRLTQPIEELPEGKGMQAWASAHPDGLIVDYPARATLQDRAGALYLQPFRGVWLAIWSAQKFALAHPQPPKSKNTESTASSWMR
jgi:4-amino-4-deoxy-L-arabinose transferase-like glycosyltransferase